MTPVNAKEDHTMSTQWTADTFIAAVNQQSGEDAAHVAHQILDWCHGRGLPIRWGIAKTTGYFAPLRMEDGKETRIFACWTIGTLEFSVDIKERIEEIPGLRVINAKADGHPSIRLADLAEPDTLASFLHLWDDLLVG